MKYKLSGIISKSELYGITYLRYPKYGLNKNIIQGISMIFNKGYDAVIVLEDDILLEEGGLEYLQSRLRMLRNDDRFGAVSLQKGKAFNETFHCWGWATWKDRWQKIDWSGLANKSWDVHLAEWMNQNNLFTLCHSEGLSKHIGYFGTHYHWYSKFGIRQYYRKWKENYYRDKDIIMGREKFPKNLFRFIKDLTAFSFLYPIIKFITRNW